MGLMKKLTSAVVASSLVLGLVGTAAADYSPASVTAAADRMKALKVVEGVLMPDGTVDMQLGANITRAQLVTIIVRAFGQRDTAALLKGAAAFPDTADHWASGEIFVAKNLIEKNGFTLGLPGGTFNPNGNVTAAEAIAFVMKFLGVQADTTKSWPMDYIGGAAKAGLLSEADATSLAAAPNAAAQRGLVFYLADSAFASHKLASGKTVYTTYVDATAPVVTVDSYQANTTAAKVTLTGTASGQSVLHVAGNAVTVGADGKWTADVELKLGANSIAVEALDVAGNVGVPASAVSITRVAGAAAKVEASLSSASVAAGSTADLSVKVFDANGAEITGADVAVTVEGEIGTFADGKFTAGTKVGAGKLNVTSGDATTSVDVAVVAGPLAKVSTSAVSVKIGEQVTLTAQDQYGNAVTGATFSQSSADALLDASSGRFVASKAGNYTVSASKDGASATATVGVYSTTVAKLVVSAPETAVGNSDDVDNSDAQSTGDILGTKYEVTVKAVDSNGNLVANYEEDIDLSVPAGFFAATDEDATIVGTTITKAAEAGSATFYVYASFDNVGRSYEFTAETDPADADPIGDETSEVTEASTEILEQVATSVKVNTDDTAKYLRANDSTDTTTVGVYVADQNGKRFLEDTGYVVALSVTGPATIQDGADSVTSTEVTYAGATETVTLESITGRTGKVTLTASVEGLGSAAATVTAAISEDAAKISVEADETTAVANDVDTITYTVQIVDANGVPVAEAVTLTGSFNTESAAELDLLDGDDNAITVTAGDDESTFAVTTDGTGEAILQLKAAKFVGELKLTLKDNDGDVAVSSGTATVSFKADEPSQFALTRTADINVSSIAPNTKLSVQLYDDAGNKAAVAGKKITFTSEADVKFNGTAEELEVTTDANGVASVDVSVLNYVNETYAITVTGEDLTAQLGKDVVDITVVNAVATTLSYTLTDAAGDPVTRVKAGEEITLTVTAKDAAGKAVSDDVIYFIPNGDVFSTDADFTDSDNLIDTTDGVLVVPTATPGEYEVTIYPTEAGSLSFTLVDETSSTAVEKTGSMRVVAGLADKLVINDGNDIEIAEGEASGAVTLKLTDEFGNAVNTSGALTVEITDGAAPYTAIGIRKDRTAPNVTSLTIPAGRSSVTFYVWNSLDAGTYTVTFEATVGGYTGNVDVVVE